MRNITKNFYQGSLDGLCGLYSTINALSALIQLSEDDCSVLFKIGLEHLDARTNLKKTILEGMRLPIVKEIINRYKPLLKEWGYALEVYKICENYANISGVASAIRDWVIEDLQCAIVGVGGRINHWTCIVEPFFKSIAFTDSDGLKRLHLCYITTGKIRKKKQYIISPEEVIGIRLLPIKMTF